MDGHAGMRIPSVVNTIGGVWSHAFAQATNGRRTERLRRDDERGREREMGGKRESGRRRRTLRKSRRRSFQGRGWSPANRQGRRERGERECAHFGADAGRVGGDFVRGGARRGRGACAQVCSQVRRAWGLRRAEGSERTRCAPGLRGWRAEVAWARL